MLLSVTSAEAAIPSPPSAPVVNDAPIAHDDGPYRAPHGRAITGPAPSLLENDTGSPLTVASGALASLPIPPMPPMIGLPPPPSYVLPMTVSTTTGATSLTYQVSNGVNVSGPATVVVESTNKPPSDSPGMYQYMVISPDPATVCPPPLSYMPIPGSPPPPPGPLGGMTHTDSSDVIGSLIFDSDPDLDPTTVTIATAPTYGSVSLLPYVALPGTGTIAWYWSYNAAPGACNVVDTFSFTIADNAGASTTTKLVHLAITNQPLWHWLTVDANDDSTT